MPTTPTSRYSPDWPKIAFAIKEREDWHCHRCGIQCLRPGDRLFTPKQRANLPWIIHEESRKGRKESLKHNRIRLSNN
jgi:hypothetical protein